MFNTFITSFTPIVRRILVPNTRIFNSFCNMGISVITIKKDMLLITFRMILTQLQNDGQERREGVRRSAGAQVVVLGTGGLALVCQLAAWRTNHLDPVRRVRDLLRWDPRQAHAPLVRISFPLISLRFWYTTSRAVK